MDREPYQRQCVAVLDELKGLRESTPFQSNIYDIIRMYDLTDYKRVVGEPLDLESLRSEINDTAKIPTTQCTCWRQSHTVYITCGMRL